MMRKMFVVFISIFILSGCSMFKMERSLKRDGVPVSIQPAKGVTLTSTGAVHIRVIGMVNTDFFPAGFKIETKEKIIYIDPVLVDDPVPADYIWITHAHGDHFSLPDIKRLLKKETLILCPETVAVHLKGYPVKAVRPGDVLVLDGVKFEAVASYNLKPGFLGFTPHPKKDGNTGCIISINGVRFYHAGDTDFIPEMRDLKNIDVAMVPIDGRGLTMSTGDAALAVNAIRPRTAIPMHYNLGTNNVEVFQKLVNKDIRVEVMQKNK